MSVLTSVPKHNVGSCIDVVGLKAGESGRSCERHLICGVKVVEGSVLRTRVLELATGLAIAIFIIEDGIESCRVGYLKKRHVKDRDQLNGRLIQVTKLYFDSENSHDRRRSHRYCGLGLGVFLI